LHKYTRQEFMDQVYLTSFKFPSPSRDAPRPPGPRTPSSSRPRSTPTAKPCLVVFKNGATTGLTLGKANNVSSYTRNYLPASTKIEGVAGHSIATSHHQTSLSTRTRSPPKGTPGLASPTSSAASAASSRRFRRHRILRRDLRYPHLLHHEGPPQHQALRACPPQPGPRL